MKDAAMLDRIIATESLKCYLLANPRKADGTPKYKTFRPYSLNSAALEALEIMKREEAKQKRRIYIY